jgi:hypothetical protein
MFIQFSSISFLGLEQNSRSRLHKLVMKPILVVCYGYQITW